MRISRQRITIINIRKRSLDNINMKLQWLGSSLGLFNLRDKDKSCFRIFIEVIKSAKEKNHYHLMRLPIGLILAEGQLFTTSIS